MTEEAIQTNTPTRKAVADQVAREAVIDRLMALPNEIREAQDRFLGARSVLADAERSLQATEDKALLTEGVIAGKNAEIRAAELRQATVLHRAAVHGAGSAADQASTHVTCLRDELRALEALVGLLRGA